MNRFKLKQIIVIFAFILITMGLASISKPVYASYNGGNLIDDSVFLNASSMSAKNIQDFLVSKGSGLANKTFLFDCTATDASEIYYKNAGAPCGKIVPASNIIYYASQIYGINPQVVLATLQKEQGLITTANPTTWQIDQAMGYGCPTTSGCVASNFLYQIDNGVWVLRLSMERARGNMTWWFTASTWVCGSAKNFYKPNLYPGQNVNFYDEDNVYYRTHYVENSATSSLYCYTPHAYNNPNGLYGLPQYGTKGRYYSGSYNFVIYFEKWFGDTSGTPFFRYKDGSAIYMLGVNNTYYLVPSNSILEAYGYWRTINKISVVDPSYTSNKTYVGTLGQSAQYESDEIYLIGSGTRYYIPNIATLNAYGRSVAQLPLGYKYYLTESSQTVSTVFKKPNDTKLFLAQDGKKRHIANGEVYASQGTPIYNQRGLSTLSHYFVDSMPEGAPLLSEGAVTLDSTNGMYSIFGGNELHHASSIQIGKDWGLSKPYDASSEILDQLPIGPPVGRYVMDSSNNRYLLDSGKKIIVDGNSGLHLNLSGATYLLVPLKFLDKVPTYGFKGTIKEAGGSAVYEAIQGSILRVYSISDFDGLGYKWDEILSLSKGFFASLQNQGVLSFADGRLIQLDGQPQVYLIDNNYQSKRHITSLSQLANFGWSMQNVIKVNTQTANHYPTDTALNTLIINQGVYWLVDSGKKWKVPTAYISDNIYGYNYNSAIELSQKNFDAIKIASDLTNLIRNASTGAIYRVEGGVKRRFTNIASFEKNSGDWGNVRNLSSDFVGSIPSGLDLY